MAVEREQAIDVFSITKLGDAGCDEFWVRVDDMRALLAKHGLHLVTDADLRVLEAMRRLEDEDLDVFAGSDQDQHDRLVSFADAIELARRGEKP